MRGEGWFRGVHISRRADAGRYWLTVGSLTFATGVGAWGAWVVAFLLYSIVASRP